MEGFENLESATIEEKINVQDYADTIKDTCEVCGKSNIEYGVNATMMYKKCKTCNNLIETIKL